jgi:exodeoxyribonuclease VII large subunit
MTGRLAVRAADRAARRGQRRRRFDANGVYQSRQRGAAGFGDLTLRFEALKAQLSAEGLFDLRNDLPDRPAVIAVVTSETGAVWHDIRTVPRTPATGPVVLSSARSGRGAPASTSGAGPGRPLRRAACARAGATSADCDHPASGGGSLEDLWSFNDEAVVRAIVRHCCRWSAGWATRPT